MLFSQHLKYSLGYLLTFVPESSFFYRSCKCFRFHRHNQLNTDIPLVGDTCPISSADFDRCHLVSCLHFHIRTKRAQKLICFLASLTGIFFAAMHLILLILQHAWVNMQGVCRIPPRAEQTGEVPDPMDMTGFVQDVMIIIAAVLQRTARQLRKGPG